MEQRIPYEPDAYVLQTRRMITEVSDWVATYTEVALNSMEHDELVGILMRHTDELRAQAQPPQQPMDAPDSPGWWAFEGKWWDRDVRRALKVADNGTVWSGATRVPIETGQVKGKWHKLTMPWDAQPSQQPMDVDEWVASVADRPENAVRYTKVQQPPQPPQVNELLAMIGELLQLTHLPERNWLDEDTALRDRIEQRHDELMKGDAQQPAPQQTANDLGSHPTQER